MTPLTLTEKRLAFADRIERKAVSMSQMLTAVQLRYFLGKLEDKSCPTHGPMSMRICENCDGVECMECKPTPCQCDNDE